MRHQRTIVVAAITFCVSSCSNSDGDQHSKTSNTQVKNPTEWQFDVTKDQMTDQISKIATLKSLDEQSDLSMICNDKAFAILFHMPQFLGTSDRSAFSYRFDDLPSIEGSSKNFDNVAAVIDRGFVNSSPEATVNNSLFMLTATGLLEGIISTNAKKLRVRAITFDEKPVDLEFFLPENRNKIKEFYENCI